MYFEVLVQRNTTQRQTQRTNKLMKYDSQKEDTRNTNREQKNYSFEQVKKR